MPRLSLALALPPTSVLPISQIPSLPSCIHFAARVMPLEDIFHVPSPEVEVDDMEAKKSWREPREHTTATTKIPTWTAGGIMEARALDRGFGESARPLACLLSAFNLIPNQSPSPAGECPHEVHEVNSPSTDCPVTAKGGRPDVNRAGNASELEND
jgi:hypothetical protein